MFFFKQKNGLIIDKSKSKSEIETRIRHKERDIQKKVTTKEKRPAEL